MTGYIAIAGKLNDQIDRPFLQTKQTNDENMNIESYKYTSAGTEKMGDCPIPINFVITGGFIFSAKCL